MKRFFFILFAFTMVIMSWEAQRSASANALDNGPIPKESIRLRIIANSDSFQDQWLKRKVRDSIVEQMNQWVKDLHSYDEARSFVAKKLPKLQQIVDNTIQQYGFSYKAVVDFGKVPFPTKLYGSYVYPAGDYEALRVRIGEAKGQNWWCVLFPPLCFIDMSNGDAVVAKKQQQPWFTREYDDLEEEKRLMREKTSADIVDYVDNTVNEQPQQELLERQDEVARAEAPAVPEVEVRFYLWDKLVSFF